MKKIIRLAVHRLTNIRSFQHKKIAAFAKDKENLKILEIGSGKKIDGKYQFSFEGFFSEKNDFIQSDIVKEYGHPVVDITTMKYKEVFDVILCMNVLEHVYDYQKGINNIYKALKPNGTAVITVPFMYPLHDEPNDYWRFTEHSLRKLLGGFSNVKIAHNSKREAVFCYYIEAVK